MMQNAIRHWHLLRMSSYKRSAFSSQLSFGLHPLRNNYSTDAKPGVIGSLRNAYDTAVVSREEQTKQRMFQTHLKYLSSTTPLTPSTFLKLLDDIKVEAGLGGIKKHLPWVADNEALKDFKQQEAIIKALTPAEQQSSRPSQIAVKKRIARSTGFDLWTVDSVLSHITSMRSIQKSLLRRIDRGGNLPDSYEELKIMMSTSGPGGRSNMPRPGIKQKKSRAKW